MTRFGAVLMISTLLVAAAACGQAGGAGADAGGGTGWPADREFRSTAVTDSGKARALVPGTEISLRFFADGRLGAQAGCNHLGGDGRIDAGRLVLGDLSMTEMGCDEPRHSQDTWLAQFLGSEPSWNLAGPNLVLRSGEIEIRLTDKKITDPDRPLVGPRWVVDTIITGEAASSVPAGVEAFLRFESEASFTGSSGCLTFAGTSQISGHRITFLTHRPSPRSCTPDMLAVENAVVRTLVQDVTYSIDGPHLTLTAPDGNGLRLRADG